MLEIEPGMVQQTQEKIAADMNAKRKITFTEEYLDFFFNTSSKIGTCYEFLNFYKNFDLARKLLPVIFDEFKQLQNVNGGK